MGDAYRVAKSRIGRILDHVAAGKTQSDEALPSSTFLFPMNCNSSTTLNAAGILQRRDSRLLFSRRGSSSRGQYMQQASERHDINTPAAEKHFSGRSQDSTAHKCDKPLFSKKAKTATNDESTSKTISSMKQEDSPMFARGVGSGMQQLSCSTRRRQYTPKVVHEAGMEWCPPMDIAESGGQFVVTVELPGVGPNDVRVEVDDERLTIMGKRTVREWRMGNSSQTYDQREIIQGPYRIIWPLPNDLNRDGISAELVDGLLRVTLPKL